MDGTLNGTSVAIDHRSPQSGTSSGGEDGSTSSSLSPADGSSPETEDQLLAFCQKLIDEVQLQEERPFSLTNCSKRSLEEGWDALWLEALEKIALTLANDESRHHLLPQILSVIAQFLDSKPSSFSSSASSASSPIQPETCSPSEVSIEWTKALSFFEHEDISFGTKSLAETREQEPGNASFNYDNAVQILIKQRVMGLLPDLTKGKPTTITRDGWVTGRCPARLDLQGGWTDTPPICYELGGKVVNVAITVNGLKPIGARVSRITLNVQSDQPLVQITELGAEKEIIHTLSLYRLDQIWDYNQPNSPGALIKAALVCTEIVDPRDGKTSLFDQLLHSIGCGLVIETWSLLPQGSGLGTSSILASCLIAVLWTITNRTYSRAELIHATLYLEQLLTTGGGWQDQVGGVVGGLNMGQSSVDTSGLQVTVRRVATSEEFMVKLFDHMVLVYTGTVRLAKNILQNVIRNWYAKDKVITECFHQLVENAEKCSQEFESENLEGIGHLLNRYWEQKKTLAPGCEPEAVAAFLSVADHLLYGASLAGAGGGGFMLLILRSPRHREEVQRLAESHLSDPRIFDIALDEDGLQVTCDGLLEHIPH